MVPQGGRYVLVVSPACPWCRRVTIARRLLGLDAAVALVEASGIGEDGFEFLRAGNFDPLLRIRTSRELYRRQPDWQVGQPTTVPVLVDLEAGEIPGRIVLNDSSEILRTIMTEWGDLASSHQDYYVGEEEPFVQAIGQRLNNHVHTIIAGKEQAREDALEIVGRFIRELNERLVGRDFLWADHPTTVDIRAFTSLQSLATTEAGRSGKVSDAYVDLPDLQRWFSRLWAMPGWVSASEAQALQLSD